MDKTNPPPEEPATFGEWVKQKRESKEFSQDKLSDKCDCDKGTISRIERDVHLPSFKTAIGLAPAFDMSLDTLADVLKKYSK